MVGARARLPLSWAVERIRGARAGRAARIRRRRRPRPQWSSRLPNCVHVREGRVGYEVGRRCAALAIGVAACARRRADVARRAAGSRRPRRQRRRSSRQAGRRFGGRSCSAPSGPCSSRRHCERSCTCIPGGGGLWFAFDAAGLAGRLSASVPPRDAEFHFAGSEGRGGHTPAVQGRILDGGGDGAPARRVRPLRIEAAVMLVQPEVTTAELGCAGDPRPRLRVHDLLPAGTAACRQHPAGRGHDRRDDPAPGRRPFR